MTGTGFPTHTRTHSLTADFENITKTLRSSTCAIVTFLWARYKYRSLRSSRVVLVLGQAVGQRMAAERYLWG